jgi:hypothetical protein
MNKLSVAITILLFALGVYTPLSADTKDLPPYDTWSCVEERINENAFKRLCMDGSMPPENVIAEFRLNNKTSSDTELLIWTEILRPFTTDPTAFRLVNRSYFRSEEPQWQGPTDTSIIDTPTLTVGVETPIFGDGSRFSQLFDGFSQLAETDGKEYPTVTRTK